MYRFDIGNNAWKLNVRLFSESTSAHQKDFEHVSNQCANGLREKFYTEHVYMQIYIEAQCMTFLKNHMHKSRFIATCKIYYQV